MAGPCCVQLAAVCSFGSAKAAARRIKELRRAASGAPRLPGGAQKSFGVQLRERQGCRAVWQIMRARRTALCALPLALHAATATAASVPIGNMAGLWRSQTMYQDWMEPPHDAGWLRVREHWPTVPQWRWPLRFNKTDLFTDEMCTDGLLGGWNAGVPGNRPKTNPPDPSQDIAYRAAGGTLAYRWSLLDARLDDMVSNGIKPLVMLGRVPWALSAQNNVSQCSYGNAAPPTNFTEWGELVAAVCEHMLTRYGAGVRSWRFRVWTEPNQIDSFSGSVEDYMYMYDFASAAIRRVLGPGPRIGPANFCRYCAVSQRDWQGPSYQPNTHEDSYWSGIRTLMSHFARGTNKATGKIGSPVDFLALSNYGCYSGSPTYKLGYQPSATAVSGALLSSWRELLGPGFEHTTLELHEFGALVNRFWRTSSEPGAFGAAWTFANWQAALASNITRAFHWGFEEGVLGFDFLQSAAWAMAMAEGAAGNATVANAYALAVRSATPLPLNTSVTAFAVQVAGSSELFLFIASLNSNKTDVPTLSVSVEIERDLVPPAFNLADGVDEYRMEKSTSVYDVALAELRRQNSTASGPLLRWDDNEVYNIMQMATPLGLTALQKNLTKFKDMQAASVQPQPFHGEASFGAGGMMQLRLTVETPCAVVLRLSGGTTQHQNTDLQKNDDDTTARRM